MDVERHPCRKLRIFVVAKQILSFSLEASPNAAKNASNCLVLENSAQKVVQTKRRLILIVRSPLI